MLLKNDYPALNYDKGTGEEKNWLVTETRFDPEALGKVEAVFSLGNGYMGLRSATEERYSNEVRGNFIAGTFNKFLGDKEVTELPNAADMLEMTFTLNGETFQLTQGEILFYERTLNLKKAELSRDIHWRSPAGEEYKIVFSRFVSLDNLHVIAQKVTITPLTNDVTVKLNSGINGQMTNTGTQHFQEGVLRLYDQKIMKLEARTTESAIDFVHFSRHAFALENEEFTPKNTIFMDRRKIFTTFEPETVAKNQTMTIEKISGVYTSRDKDWNSVETALELFSKVGNYDTLFTAHQHAWQSKVWKQYPIQIEGANFDQLAIRFAVYHLTGMTPAHDNRMNIGAKGFSGEGYKGHAFWDTEIFVLPFFTTSNPTIARQLLEYRWLSLPGAVRKAVENNYEGAMFPWESAWLEDGEVTPVWGAADIITGEPTKIWSGFIEQHITADIAFAVWQYYQFTGDKDFMEKHGYELIFATAVFWQSRLEKKGDQYEITGVVGPDEYKEHVDNNAFTNYMAHWNLEKAIHYYELLQQENPALLASLSAKWDLTRNYTEWQEKSAKLYLPQPNAELVIPQDDTYLSKKIIDLAPYKASAQVGALFLDYNLDQVNDMQITKQADVMILLYLLENEFSPEVKQANWDYYEPKTLHDSSLSRATHSILASDLGDKELAYSMFEKASRIDLGQNMKSSDAGIHSASIGGIWQVVVNGFGGVRMLDGKLFLHPHLPEKWTALSFPIYWKGSRLLIHVTQTATEISNTSNQDVVLTLNGKEISILANTTFTTN
ncbi:glycoside hydrolase family 65 protein [Listeria booriae]|uniref:Trehalase n=1 Tax=Listeria booriae TaxID=1552123 RepID=A0A099W3J4_9LIST|nr:glycosyl hydrolase family 65 protein [Listeria booriae]KGL40414.1 trehalase [Listeria booriae]MBC1905019.1 glycoside hydrolase family 65 protein [Listeria booriae]STY42376.1 Kojibiose phosphorylase [Listeria booriae]